jgi:hypothetical protein
MKMVILISGSIKDAEFLDHLSNYYLLTEYSSLELVPFVEMYSCVETIRSAVA